MHLTETQLHAQQLWLQTPARSTKHGADEAIKRGQVESGKGPRQEPRGKASVTPRGPSFLSGPSLEEEWRKCDRGLPRQSGVWENESQPWTHRKGTRQL